MTSSRPADVSVRVQRLTSARLQEELDNAHECLEKYIMAKLYNQ